MALTDKLTAIADAIRGKTGGTAPLMLAQMPGEIAGIKTDPVLQELAITENGEYTPGEGVDGFSRVTVEVEESGNSVNDIIMSNYTGSFSPVMMGANGEVVGLPDPFVLNLPKCNSIGTIFNCGKVNCKTMELHLASGVVTMGTVAGGGGFKPSGIETVVIRSGDSNVITVANKVFTYAFNSPTLKTIDCVLDMTNYSRNVASSYFAFGECVEYVRFAPNTLHVSADFGTGAAFADDSIVSIANALQSGTAYALTLHNTVKARCGEIVGTVSTVAVGNSAYDLFSADPSGTVTLTEFITNVKGWTLA